MKNLRYMKIYFTLILILCFFIFGCKDAQDAASSKNPMSSSSNGEDGEDGEDGKNSIIKSSAEAAGINCSNGGLKIEFGLDSDGDNVLDTNEITSTQYVCNGTAGSDGIKPSASLYCGAQLEGTTYYFTYNAMVFSDSSVYAYGGIYGGSYQIGASTFYDSSQTGALTGTVIFQYDVSGSANGGYWSIYINRSTLAATIDYNDSDVTGGKLTWSLNSSSNNCVLNSY